MELVSESRTRMRLVDQNQQQAGILTYKDISMREGSLEVIDHYRIRYTGTGKWESFRLENGKETLLCRIKVNRGAVM